jgi:hypothetical protein
MENRNGLVLDFELTEANGYAERDAAVAMLKRERRRRPKSRRPRRITLAADAGYDAREFIGRCRDLRVTPHVAQKKHSAIDRRTTTHIGYALSTRARRLIEKIFGWMKTTGAFRRSRFKGRPKTAFAAGIVAASYNLLRLSNLPSPVTR